MPVPEPSSKVREAQGMVCEQVHCTLPEALAKLTERAKVTGLRLEEVAVAIVERRTQFR
ncbi:MAG: ANTAR domain-containing protein [Acidimicrobiia bacterium]